MLHGRLLPAGGWRNEKGGHCWLRESQQLTLCAFSTKSNCPWFVSSTRCRMVLVVQRECRDVGGFRLAGNVGRLRARNAAAVSGEHRRVRVHAFQRSRFVRGFCHQHAVARSMWSRGNVETLEGSAWPENVGRLRARNAAAVSGENCRVRVHACLLWGLCHHGEGCAFCLSGECDRCIAGGLGQVLGLKPGKLGFKCYVKDRSWETSRIAGGRACMVGECAWVVRV